MSWQGQWAGNSVGRWFGYTAEAAVSGVAGGGGGVSKWPGRSEFGWEKWRKKKDADLEKRRIAAQKRVELLQKQVWEKKQGLETSRDLKAIQALMKELEALEKKLQKAIAVLDELEMEEVMLIYALTR